MAEKHSDPGVTGVKSGLHDLGEKAGFETNASSYIDKKGTQQGEGAKFNYMPPGMDIDHQECADIRAMPMKKVTSESYPGDGY